MAFRMAKSRFLIFLTAFFVWITVVCVSYLIFFQSYEFLRYIAWVGLITGAGPILFGKSSYVYSDGTSGPTIFDNNALLLISTLICVGWCFLVIAGLAICQNHYTAVYDRLERHLALIFGLPCFFVASPAISIGVSRAIERRWYKTLK